MRKALEKIPSRYELTVVAAERCKQLMNGARPLVDPKGDHPRKIALREIAEGKLVREGNQYVPVDDGGSLPDEVRPVQAEEDSEDSSE